MSNSLPSLVPLITESGGSSWASAAVLFGSFSASSVKRCVTWNSFGLLTPNRPTKRTSYVPEGTSGATLTLNLRSAVYWAVMPG